MPVDKSFHYTPKKIAKELINDINFIDNEKVLETCRGGGAFYDILPDNINKDWCEIDMGRDFFKYNESCDISISNMPYRIDGKNIVIPWMNHQFSLTKKECWFLLNAKMWSSITPPRLKKWKDNGWNICFLKILSISKWYGRYYWLCFSKIKPSIINF